jgi:uncharacterized membrane protein HdeD (DUF308 family)
MLSVLSRNWWMVALRGVAAILFGFTAIIWPDITVGVLVAFFGAYAIVDGALLIGSAFSGPSGDRFWHLLGGVAGIAVGLVAWVWPGLTAVTLLYIIASWAIILGVTEVIAAVALREWLAQEWLLVVSGVVSVLFGTLLFIFPGDGAIALVTTIGIFAMIIGGTEIGLAFRLRGLNQDRPERGPGMGRTVPS